MITIHQRYIWTTCDCNTALCTIVHRAVKIPAVSLHCPRERQNNKLPVMSLWQCSWSPICRKFAFHFAFSDSFAAAPKLNVPLIWKQMAISLYIPQAASGFCCCRDKTWGSEDVICNHRRNAKTGCLLLASFIDRPNVQSGMSIGGNDRQLAIGLTNRPRNSIFHSCRNSFNHFGAIST